MTIPSKFISSLQEPSSTGARSFRYLEASDFNAVASAIFHATRKVVQGGSPIAATFLRIDLDPASPGSFSFIEPLSPLRPDLNALMQGGALRQRLPETFGRLLGHDMPHRGRYPMVGYLCDALPVHGAAELHLWLACVDSIRVSRFKVIRTETGRDLLFDRPSIVSLSGSPISDR